MYKNFLYLMLVFGYVHNCKASGDRSGSSPVDNRGSSPLSNYSFRDATESERTLVFYLKEGDRIPLNEWIFLCELERSPGILCQRFVEIDLGKEVKSEKKAFPLPLYDQKRLSDWVKEQRNTSLENRQPFYLNYIFNCFAQNK